MTRETAILFFPHEKEDDLSDLYDERLFEYKQFFLAKTPIRKVFEAKLEKLMQMDNAYRFLTDAVSVAEKKHVAEVVSFSDVIAEAFNQWETLKGKCKQQLMLSNDAVILKQNVLEYLNGVDAYRRKWYTENEIDVEINQLSKDEDPMAVLEAIKSFEQEGGIYFNDILKMNSNSFLLKEMKRLSLLVKNYGDGARSI